MVLFLDQLGWETVGIDNNMRAEFFGPDGDTAPVARRLQLAASGFHHLSLDIRDRAAMDDVFKRTRPSFIVHAAAQPSHDLAKDRPFDDFDVNAVGTLNLLEAARRHCPRSPFVFLSTNKVYGDSVNRVALKELPTRFAYADPAMKGIDESFPLDASMHSLMGASKLSADILVQEYGRTFGMPTVCFRCGCLTGSAQAGAELHGFLSYMSRAVREGRTYRVLGYAGKQVRDNLHAHDVCAAAYAFFQDPKIAAIYNLGGGQGNSVSVIEALERFARIGETRPEIELTGDSRAGDHKCYITDTGKFRRDYPQWSVTKTLDMIFEELMAVPAAARV